MDGSQLKNGVQVTYSGLTFSNTSLRFFDASVTVRDTVFMETKVTSMDIEVLNLPRFDLAMNGVVFQHNRACLRIKASNRIEISVNITKWQFSCVSSFVNLRSEFYQR